MQGLKKLFCTFAAISTLATNAEEATAEGDHEELERVKCDIDKNIYHLYDLTYDEILVIDPETPIKKEEYEHKLK